MNLQEFVKEVRENCVHKKLGDWIAYCWAPGHYTDKEVRSCLFCGKIVKSRKVRK